MFQVLCPSSVHFKIKTQVIGNPPTPFSNPRMSQLLITTTERWWNPLYLSFSLSLPSLPSTNRSFSFMIGNARNTGNEICSVLKKRQSFSSNQALFYEKSSTRKINIKCLPGLELKNLALAIFGFGWMEAVASPAK